MCVGACKSVHGISYLWRSKDNFPKRVPSFHHVEAEILLLFLPYFVFQAKLPGDFLSLQCHLAIGVWGY